jgi:hypothetical protein
MINIVAPSQQFIVFLMPYKWAEKARTFAPGKPFRPNVIHGLYIAYLPHSLVKRYVALTNPSNFNQPI